MKRILIQNCDEKLKGVYHTDANEKEIEDAINGCRSICINKEKKDGSISSSHDYYPFNSYHNNRDIRKAYNDRNGKATLEVLDETKINKIIENVMHEQDGNIFFKIDNHDFKAYFQSNRKKSFDIYADDEGDFYKAYCQNKLSDDAIEQVVLYDNIRNLYVTDITGGDWKLNDFNNHNVYLSYRHLPRENDYIIPFIGYFQDQENAQKVLNYLYKTLEKEASEVKEWYKKNKHKFSICGYWVNR